jgi:predicted nucleic acid-binding protein
VIQLDTGFLIRALVPDSAEATRLRHWIEKGESVGISALAWTEFLCGPVSARVVALAASFLGDPVSFDKRETALAAKLFSESGRRRGTLVDCMIAATAIVAGDSLATSNGKDFARFEEFGLTLAI